MSNSPHKLSDEFPGAMDRINGLKTKDGRFAELTELYDEISGAVHRAETKIDTVTPQKLDSLKQERARLKDAVQGYLSK